MNILKNIVRVGLIVTALSFNLVSCDYLDVVPPEQAGLQDATKTRKSTLGFLFQNSPGGANRRLPPP